MGEKIAKGELVHSILTVNHTHAKRGTTSSSDEIVALTAMFHDMLVYLQDMAHAATRISTGDLSQNVTPRSTDDVLGTAFQRMSAYLNEMATAATAISEGDIQHNIQPKTEQDVLGHAFNHLIAYIQRQVQVAEQIANGDVSVKVNILSDADVLGKSLNMMVENIRNIITELNVLTQSALAGKLDIRGNAEKFGGEYAEIIKGMNATMDAIIGPLHVAAEYMRRISKGDFPEPITNEYKGDFNAIKQSVNTLITTMDGLQKETDGLIHAIQNGNLSIHGNAEAFEGAWQVLVAGINSLIEAFVTPITMTGMYLDRIAKGDIPDKLTQEYQGDFNMIKNNLNTLIETMSSLLNETNGLILAIQEGRLDARGDAEAFVGDWRELMVGINNVINAFVAPINVTAEFIDRIAKGDIPDKLTEAYKGDFNEIKQNLNLLIDAMYEITRLAEAIAAGNLTVEVQERSTQDNLMRALNMMIQRLSEVVSNVKMVANHVATSSEQMTSSAANMSQGAAQQAAAMEEASSSMQQMAANIRQNADNARETEKIALQSAEYAEEGGKVVAETVMAMQQIAEKIAIIEDIATQTRMLSLNATIEAARAQEHGKAFSVVASEVRQLSDITKKAAEEISKVATSSLDVSEKAGEMLTTLVPSIHKTAELVQEISAASSEQSTGAEQINTAIQQLDQVTQQNASTSDELASMAETLSHQATQLLETIAFFEVGGTAETTMQEAKKTREKVLTEPVTETGPKVTRHEELKEGAEDRETGDGKPAGHGLEMIPDEAYGDERDAEFERY
jgi:methyl-accepting chemotaxis protein